MVTRCFKCSGLKKLFELFQSPCRRQENSNLPPSVQPLLRFFFAQQAVTSTSVGLGALAGAFPNHEGPASKKGVFPSQQTSTSVDLLEFLHDTPLSTMKSMLYFLQQNLTKTLDEII